MTAAQLLHTCPVCGAEESLESLMARMVDDDQVRRLISDVLTCSLQLGSLTLRYLRLHKPPKHRLRLEMTQARPPGERVYEATAVGTTSAADMPRVFPLLAQALLYEFPGPSGQSRVIRVELPKP